MDRVIRGTDAFGNLRDYKFDPNGNPVQNRLVINGFVIDQTASGYDLSDRRTSVTNSGSFTSTYDYDAAGNVVQITDPDGRSLGFN